MLEKVVDGLLEGNEKLVFTLKSRTGISRRQLGVEDRVAPTPAPKVREISFPGSTAQEAWNFS